MKHASVYGFVFGMWILMILGGAILVVILGPFSISGFSEFDSTLTSVIKAIISILLIILWIFILSKMKDWVYQNQMKS